MNLTPEYWLSRPEFYGVEVLDPDGWDRANFETSWSEPITREEMERRLMSSTVCISSDSPLHPRNVLKS